jgi:hypothetical protein
MKNILIAAAVAAGLLLSYISAAQFALRHDPWPLVCVLSILLIASVCGLIRRPAQFMLGNFTDGASSSSRAAFCEFEPFVFFFGSADK